MISFARTIETWQEPIIAAVQTGLTNARTEGHNRIVENHVGEKPMAITWELHTPLPGDLYQSFAVAGA